MRTRISVESSGRRKLAAVTAVIALGGCAVHTLNRHTMPEQQTISMSNVPEYAAMTPAKPVSSPTATTLPAPESIKPVVIRPAVKKSTTPKVTAKPTLAQKVCLGEGQTPYTQELATWAAFHPKIGTVALLCAAAKFDKFGYISVAGPGTAHGTNEQFEQFYNGFVANGGFNQAPFRIADCTGLVRLAEKVAFGVTADNYNGDDFTQQLSATGQVLFKRVPLTNVHFGDVLAYPGHAAIAAGNGDASQISIFNAENPTNGILLENYWHPAWTGAFEYIGPGSEQD